MWRFGLIIFAGFLGFLLAPYSARASGLIRPPNNLGLVGSWTFNDGAGILATDSSGTGNSGVVTNMEEADWVTGKRGGALDFGGGDEYVVVAESSSLKITQAVTLAAWVRRTDASAYAVPVSKRSGSGGSQLQYQLTWVRNNEGAHNDKIRLDITAAGSIRTVNSDSAYSQTNEWHHLAATYDRSNMRVYFDGVLAGTAAQTNEITDFTNNVFIGQDNEQAPGLPSYSKAAMDDVRIYSRALTATEVAALYNSGAVKQKVATDLGLVGYWSLDDASGTKATDSSGRGSTGTLTNMEVGDWVAGKRGKALTFDGSDEYVDAGASTALAPTVMTLSMWVNPTAYPAPTGNAFAEPLRKEDSYEVSFRGASVTPDPSVLEVGIKTASLAPSVMVPFSQVPLATWTHVALTADGSNLRVYINGAQYGSAVSYTGNIANTAANHLFFGTYGTTAPSLSRYFNGKVDEVRIYDRALAAGEVVSLYQSGGIKVNGSQNGKMTSGLVGLWSFNGQDVTGTIAYDRSGQGNNATLTNSPSPDSGKVGQALNFDGINDYVDVGDTSVVDFGSGDYAFSAWIYPRTTSGNVISKDAASVRQFVGMAVSSGDLHTVLFYTGGAVPAFVWYNTNDTPISANQWHHVVVQRHGNTFESYVNGVAHTMSKNAGSTSDLPQTMVSNTTSMTIGKRLFAGSEDLFNGNIDEMRVYDRSLSAAEIQLLYKQGK